MKKFILIALVLILSACSSNEVVVVNDNGEGLSNVNSYSLFPRDSGFTEQQNISDMLRNSIELAIERSLDDYGFNYKEVADADIVIAYQLTGLPILRPFTASGRLSQCPQCNLTEKNKQKKRQSRHMSPQEQRMKSRALLQADNARNIGDLVIDVIDSKSRKTLWQGQYPLKVKNTDSSTELQAKIREAVVAITQVMFKQSRT